MRRLIFQVAIPTGNTANFLHGYHRALYQESRTRFSLFAEKKGYEYFCVTKSSGSLHPTYERFQLFEEQFDSYDQILYVDSDIVPRESMPDPFEVYPGAGFYAFPETKAYYGRDEELNELLGVRRYKFLAIWKRLYESKEAAVLPATWIRDQYFNAGVFMVTKDVRKELRKVELRRESDAYPLYDQSKLNYMLYRSGIGVKALNFRFNAVLHTLNSTLDIAKVVVNSHFLHFSGDTKTLFNSLNLETDDIDAVLVSIDQWKNQQPANSRWFRW